MTVPHAGAVREPGGVVYRRVEAADSEELLALFHDVFRADGAPARSLASWRWRFERAPLGNHSCLAQDRDGRIVAHIGGTPHATLWRGTLRRSLECVDHMVAPDRRHGLGGTNLFARLVQRWYAEYCGPDAGFLAWGFPSPALFRVGLRYAGYGYARSVDLLLCPDAGRLVEHVPGVEVVATRRFDTAADELWARCAPELDGAVVRDATHLNWRYGDCPHQEYVLLEARDARGGTLRGLAVLRGGGIAPDVGMLMELLVPAADGAARRVLLSAAGRAAVADGRSGLVACFPPGTRNFHLLVAHGFGVRPTDRILAARSWDAGVDLEQVRRRLCLSFGDMDSY